jgi:hypothetical protein
MPRSPGGILSSYSPTVVKVVDISLAWLDCMYSTLPHQHVVH